MAGKFSPTMYVTAYQLARDGLADIRIADAIGVAWLTFRRWMRQRPALVDALTRGRCRGEPGKEQTFREYVYDHLSPHLQDVWKEINACAELDNGVERIEALLSNHGKRAKQHLFVYALTQSMFNVSQSLRKIGIPRKTYETWCQSDPDFSELMDEMHWHKENFFEQAFMGRVAAGDTLAIIHAAKTKLRDRGYNDKVEVVHSGSIGSGDAVSITALDLDVETKKKVLDALRRKLAADAATKALTTG